MWILQGRGGSKLPSSLPHHFALRISFFPQSRRLSPMAPATPLAESP
jgi:hypothetical protein